MGRESPQGFGDAKLGFDPMRRWIVQRAKGLQLPPRHAVLAGEFEGKSGGQTLQPEQAYALPPAPGDEPAPEDPDAV